LRFCQTLGEAWYPIRIQGRGGQLRTIAISERDSEAFALPLIIRNR
jgi:hypothetical protein